MQHHLDNTCIQEAYALRARNFIGIMPEVPEPVFWYTTATHVPYASSGPIGMRRHVLTDLKAERCFKIRCSDSHMKARESLGTDSPKTIDV